MCQATVYLGDREIAREVTRLELAEDGVRLAALFEEPKVVPRRIRHIDFLKHRVLLGRWRRERMDEAEVRPGSRDRERKMPTGAKVATSHCRWPNPDLSH